MMDSFIESTDYPKCLFAYQDRLFFSLGSKQSLPSPKGAYPLIGGMDFHSYKRKEKLWAAFPSKAFIEPKTWGWLNRPCSLVPQLPKAKKRIDLPHFNLYAETPVLQGKLEKLVLAKRTSFFFEEILSTRQVIDFLFSLPQELHLIYYEVSPGELFISASPELLYRRSKSRVFTEAVAGTSNYPDELILSPYYQEEISLVEQSIQESLLPLCQNGSLVKSERKVKKAAHLFHLHSKWNGELLLGIDDEKILQEMHPTAAVGGYPKEEALRRLYEIEPFDRGRYAAPFGLFFPEESYVVVGIRSALIQKKILHAFAGSGWCKGYRAEAEWDELEQKIALYKW